MSAKRGQGHTELTPIGFSDLDPEALGGAPDAVPSRVTLCVGNALDLVEAGDRIAHIGPAFEGLLALLRKGEVFAGQRGTAHSRQAYPFANPYPGGVVVGSESLSYAALRGANLGG